MKKIYALSSVFAFVTGVILLGMSVTAWFYVQKNVLDEKIVTPKDASLPGQLVKGPFTLKSQADVIRIHTLKITGGKTYAEMPREIEKKDELGNTVLDSEGKPVMVPNESRNIWITATTLITALHLGILGYVVIAFGMLLGLISIWNGFLFFALYRKS